MCIGIITFFSKLIKEIIQSHNNNKNNNNDWKKYKYKKFFY